MNILTKLFKSKKKIPEKINGFDDIKTSQIMTLWNLINPRPNQVKKGEEVAVPMISGKTGRYVLIEVDYSTHWTECDWEWYILRFVGYKE